MGVGEDECFFWHGGSSGSKLMGEEQWQGPLVGGANVGDKVLSIPPKLRGTQTGLSLSVLTSRRRSPIVIFFRWVDDMCNELMELEEARIHTVELDVAEMNFKLKYMEMMIREQDVKITEQGMKLHQQERKLNDVYLKMVEELDRMDKKIRTVDRSARVLGACVGVIMICMFVVSVVKVKTNDPNVFFLQ
ncbi:uncharacterized protein LOC133308916 [Gastrolobium bilobum]|uniref:uncharacterized protein LOC133308916 n=1 Tax=Gastrolobium bilobum TaxID=150636 RepID=UPI002AB076D4|nr:uncharacterized protein LOC133308916 [Gastrolobium bilobum]